MLEHAQLAETVHGRDRADSKRQMSVTAGSRPIPATRRPSLVLRNSHPPYPGSLALSTSTHQLVPPSLFPSLLPRLSLDGHLPLFPLPFIFSCQQTNRSLWLALVPPFHTPPFHLACPTTRHLTSLLPHTPTPWPPSRPSRWPRSPSSRLQPRRSPTCRWLCRTRSTRPLFVPLSRAHRPALPRAGWPFWLSFCPVSSPDHPFDHTLLSRIPTHPRPLRTTTCSPRSSPTAPTRARASSGLRTRARASRGRLVKVLP